MHMGGLRMVGENGPELEATGAARIYSATQTRAMMGGNTEKLEELVVKLTEEVARMRDENTQLVKNGNADLRRVRLIEERREAEAQA
jgi:HPt (histidine-containing phosphotransfer) domain-containing protein